MKTNRAVLGLGSNIDPEENTQKAIDIIRTEFSLIKISSFVRTEPVGFKEQAPFLNGALLIETELDAAALKTRLKEIEIALGRVRMENRNGPRTIDLDIIVWNGEVVDDDVYERDFLKSSIRELLPGFTF